MKVTFDFLEVCRQAPKLVEVFTDAGKPSIPLIPPFDADQVSTQEGEIRRAIILEAVDA